MMQDPDSGIDVVSAGINLTEFYPSVEWDILDVPARKNEERFPCCEEPYPGNTTEGSRFSSLFITVTFVLSRPLKISLSTLPCVEKLFSTQST